jgi:RHS repeat-associated protein
MGITNYYSVEGEMVGDNDGVSRTDYCRDALGNVVRSNANWRYKPYGQWLTVPIGVPLPLFGWIGSYGYMSQGTVGYDVYVRARHFTYATARWTTVDPLWPQEPAYTYAGANPTNRTDPSGMQGSSKPKGQGQQSNPPFHYGKPHRIPFQKISGEAGLITFSYGAYCGSANVRNPGYAVIPQDCVDACCQYHDRCLEANQGAGYSNAHAHTCCDYRLLRCVTWAQRSGCCHKSPNFAECHDAAFEIAAAFTYLVEYPSNPTWLQAGDCVPESQWPHYVRQWWQNDKCDKPKEVPYTGPKTW